MCTKILKREIYDSCDTFYRELGNNLTRVLPYIVHYIQNIMVLQEKVFQISFKVIETFYRSSFSY